MTHSPTTPANPAQAEKLGRFGHHPDPATDFETEVHDIECEVYHHRVAFLNGTPPLPDLIARIERAMEFQVGGVETAVAAKQRLRELEKEAAALSPVNPAQVTDAWLVTSGPDGQCAKVVVGFDSLKREVVAAVFGDGNDDSEEAQDMRDRLDTPGDWEGDRWSMSWSFEDGYLNVQRISDLSALTAAIGAGGQAVAWQWRKRDRVMKHEENWSYVDYHTGLKIAEHPDKYEVRPLFTHPAPSGQAVAPLDDDQIMEIIKEVAPWKHEPKLNDLLTYEKSPPLFPQATYDVPSYRAVNFVRAVEKRLSAIAHPVQPGWRK